MVVAANVCQHATCFGDATPSLEALFIAVHHDNPIPEAYYLMSAEDMQLPEVQAFVGKHLKSWDCSNGYTLHSYAKKEAE
jgi:hypothetical protein